MGDVWTQPDRKISEKQAILRFFFDIILFTYIFLMKNNLCGTMRLLWSGVKIQKILVYKCTRGLGTEVRGKFNI